MHHSGENWELIVSDVMDGLKSIESNSVHTCITSPPYWKVRDYGFDGQIGLEKTPEEYLQRIVSVFGELRRVLRNDGTLWVNIGDSYSSGSKAGLPAGNLVGIPWRFAIAMQADGWILRSQIIWSKKSPMPETIRGHRWHDGKFRTGSWRPTKSHEEVFLFVKSSKYFCDGDSSKEPTTGGAHSRGASINPKAGVKHLAKQNEQFSRAHSDLVTTRNIRSVWTLGPESYKGSHFAVFPTALVRKCLVAATSRAGCCSQCGSQFAPVVSTLRRPTRPGTCSKVTKRELAIAAGSRPSKPHNPNQVGNRDPQRHETITEVLGYQATCCCQGAECSRPIVLDPFTGSGTTGQVAINMGCKFIGIEASEQYAELAVERINKPWQPKSERVKAKRRKKVRHQQKQLFPQT